MYLSRSVNTSYHLHIIVDVTQRLCNNHCTLTLVTKLLRSVKTNTSRSRLVKNKNIKLTIIKLTLHPLLVLVGSLSCNKLTFLIALNIHVSPSKFTYLITPLLQFLNHGIKRTDKHATCTITNEILQLIIRFLPRRPKLLWSNRHRSFCTITFNAILHYTFKTPQQTCSKSRLSNNFSCIIFLYTTLHRTFKSNNRMAASLNLFLYLINNGICLQCQHELFSVIISLTCKRGVFNPHFFCAFLHTGTCRHDSQLPTPLFKERNYIFILKLNNGIKGNNRTVIILPCSPYSFRVINSFPVRNDTSHVTLTTNHLPRISQSTAHNFLQRNTTLFYNGYQFICVNIGFTHGSAKSIHRHRVRTLGKSGTGKCNTSRTLDNTLKIRSGITCTSSRVTFIKQQKVITSYSPKKRCFRCCFALTLTCLYSYTAFFCLRLAYVITRVYLRISQHRIVVFIWQFTRCQHFIHL